MRSFLMCYKSVGGKFQVVMKEAEQTMHCHLKVLMSSQLIDTKLLDNLQRLAKYNVIEKMPLPDITHFGHCFFVIRVRLSLWRTL